jgi:hypothetical protein
MSISRIIKVALFLVKMKDKHETEPTVRRGLYGLA